MVRRYLSERVLRSLIRGLKIVVANAALAAIVAGWSYFQGDGFGLGPEALAFIVAVGSPVVVAAEKYLRWVAAQ